MNALLCGACGRMGKMVASLAIERGETIVCGVDRNPSPMPFPVYRSFGEVTEAVSVVIDFSSGQDPEERLRFCEERGIGIVLAATGYTEEDERLVRAYAEKIPVFKTGNLSVGVSLLRVLAKKAAAVLGDFDAEIIERHHDQKKDAPSGTALMLAESVNEGFGNTKEYVFGRHGMVGAREKREIGIHAVRGGNIVGEHEVMFAGEDEIVTLSHSARSRRVFAAGALRAADWIGAQSAGLYDMDDLLADHLG